MIHPFQRLLYCSRAVEEKSKVLLAASGPSLCSFDVSDGSLLSVWRQEDSFAPSKELKKVSPNGHVPEKIERQSPERPSKRSRYSSSNGYDSTSTEMVTESGNGNGVKSQYMYPSITKLAGTSDGQHVVAITGDDKSVRVLKLLANGTLVQLSVRYEAARA